MVSEMSTDDGGWWEEHGDLLPSWLTLSVGFEQTASLISIFQPEFVNGLLQTGMHTSVNGPYTLYQFSSPEEEPVVYVPLLIGGRYIEKVGQRSAYETAFSNVWPVATPIREYTS